MPLIPPIPEYYVVDPDKLLAGNYPKAYTEEELRAKFQFFFQNVKDFKII